MEGKTGTAGVVSVNDTKKEMKWGIELENDPKTKPPMSKEDSNEQNNSGVRMSKKLTAAQRFIKTAAGIHFTLQKLEGKMPVRHPWNRFWWDRMIVALQQEIDEIREKLETEPRHLQLVENVTPVAIPEFERTK